MAPLRKARPVKKGGRERANVGGMEQAGRTELSLAAERNTAEIQPTIPSLVASPITSPVVTPVTTPEIRLSVSNLTTERSDHDMPQHLGRPSSASSAMNTRPSYAPIIPSPLNPGSSLSSLSSSEEGVTLDRNNSTANSDSSRELSRSRSAGNLRVTEKEKGASLLSLPQELLNQRSPPLIGGDISRTGTPKGLKDLGQDYSRYPQSREDLRLGEPSRAPPPTPRSKPSPLLRTTTTNPFNDSEADLEKWGYPDDRIGTFDPYYGGEKGFILYKDEPEEDDKFHLPMDDDDITYRAKLSEYFDPRSIVSTVGGIFLILGLLAVFIVLPVLTYATNILAPNRGNSTEGIPAWARVNYRDYELANNVRRGLIDPDTPESAKTRKSTFDNSELKLVFSDEFNEPGRTFYPGDDPYWTGADLWYGATQDMEWYDPDAITTGNGTLQLRLDNFPNHGLQYRSGMLNSWNQMCFKGGVFEVSASLAGPAGVPGLWPGAWTMGNLGRPGYKATTEGVWPYTYDSCDIGITPNQSSPDGLSHLPGQKLSSCTCKGADHPNPGTGRGAPEIDILEGSVDPRNRIGVITQSYQVAPFDVFYRPNSDFMAIPNYETTQMNSYCGGPFQQAISGTTLLNNDWYDGNAYQKYAFEYVPGTSKGKVAWFVGDDPTFILDGRAIGPNGNVAARQISQEPMSMILNLGISGSWTEIFLADLKFPTIMHIDYVRVYQKPGQTMVTCDPPGYPTTDYIKKHPIAYNNVNLTDWDSTGYGWPKNKLTGC